MRKRRMLFLEPQNGMSCREGQSLMSLHVKDDPSITQEQREAFEDHLMVCSVCAEEYKEDTLRWKLQATFVALHQDAQVNVMGWGMPRRLLR